MDAGAANYGCIPGLSEFEQNIVLMVATHHGSIRSITNGSQFGTNIKFVPYLMPMI